MYRFVLFTMCFMCQSMVFGQSADSWHVVKEFAQQRFPATVPAGNYSGITHISDNVYALVSDKSDSALYFNMQIDIDRNTGELMSVNYLESHGEVEAPGLDHEGIAKVSDSKLVISSEGKCRLKEYMISTDSIPTSADGLWQWSMPQEEFWPNYSFESLAYDSVAHRLWTVSESTLRRDGVAATIQNGEQNVLRLLSFDLTNRASAPISYLYKMDAPTARRVGGTYVMGVSELCVLPGGSLLVLEREAYVPQLKIGAFCQCKLYVVDVSSAVSYPFEKVITPSAPFVQKRLLTSWRTQLGLFHCSWANYEGMCLAPQLDNGQQVLLLVSDSQDQYAGVLSDWFKTIVLACDADDAEYRDGRVAQQSDEDVKQNNDTIQ